MSSSRAGYHHGDLAHALETAAMQLLAEKPAQQISLREVARAANVSHNAPYHHFADRSGLLKALAERAMTELLAQVRGAVAGGRNARDAFLAGGAAYLRFAVERPYAFEAVYDPTVCIPGAPTPAMAGLIAELEGMLSEGAHAAGLTKPAEFVSVWGMIHGLGTLSAAGHLTLDEALAAHAAGIERMLPPN